MQESIYVPKLRIGSRRIDIIPFWVILLLVGLGIGAVGA